MVDNTTVKYFEASHKRMSRREITIHKNLLLLLKIVVLFCISGRYECVQYDYLVLAEEPLENAINEK